MQYPVAKPDDWRLAGRLALGERIHLFFRNRRYRRRARQPAGVTLTALRQSSGALAPDALILICVVRNGEIALPSLLAHYRRLGVDRFAFVDDGSDDRSREILVAADDVDLYESNVDFRGSEGGLAWRDMLVDRYGRNRWYVSIDADEYLVFPGCEERPLTAFIDDLKRNGLTRALGPMIDLYPDGPLSDAPSHFPPEASPTEFSPLFDGDGYTMRNEDFCMAIRGGPRWRVFGADMRVTKFPLVFVDAVTQFSGGTHHGMLPFSRNYSAVHCVLLHYKFPSDATKHLRSAVKRGMHSGDSKWYKVILASGAFDDGADLRYPGSLCYHDSQQLVDRGFMQDLRDVDLTQPRQSS